MDKYTIMSPLTLIEWKRSWEKHVVDDSDRANQNSTRMQNCYWGHFKNEKDFTICFHKEFESKALSLGSYFNGTIERHENGSKITGSITRKKSANIFLTVGIIIFLLVSLVSFFSGERMTALATAVLFFIFLAFRVKTPKQEETQLLDIMKTISSDHTVCRDPKKREQLALQAKLLEEKKRLAEQNSGNAGSGSASENVVTGPVSEDTGTNPAPENAEADADSETGEKNPAPEDAGTNPAPENAEADSAS
ncbi:MAG: hypothetical protein HUJ73_07750 [Eubacterium sp.]|nr:hypothetical protein [Eubacterium sp.]